MNDRRLRLLGIPLLSVLIVLLSLPGQAHPLRAGMVLLQFTISLLFTLVLWLGNRALWGVLLQRFPGVEQTARRLWWLVGACLLYTSVATLALVVLLHQLMPAYFSLTPRFLFNQIAFDLIPTLIVQLIYESRHFFGQWEHNLRRAEQLSRAGVQSQLEALQNQLDPHFLFNSLNTLSALIDAQNEPAQQFVEQLADVYRYVLESRNQPTVPLAEELAFVDAYLALQKVRFRDNLRVEQHVPAALLRHRVAPLSVQVLVENALKHNVVSREHPLSVSITAEDGFLRVQNSFRPRASGLGASTGLGLQNTVHRYELLQAPHPVRIEAAAATFTVWLPLLPA
ncbi:histidine kinase [Hymenobacter sp. BT175]|uniref:sensor histidine kinase n=1 Tax=Hymenobacter translucens TaxID=2886507 RepID=UPI001D0E3B88|nr:histidine kinase [Hymenobacter translucens]MCC2546757.1 histidine kinase [Hymenobacter translucens]